MRLHEWEHRQFVNEKVPQDFLPTFIEYLTRVWQNRNRYIEAEEEFSEEEEQERKIHKQRFFDFTIDGKISARNYVGIVQYEGIRIEVVPKIFTKTEITRGKNWGIQLLYWVSYCRKFKFPFSLADISTVSFDDFLEMLIAIFSNYAEDVLSRQPYQSYQEIREEHSYLKGRLIFDEYTKNNLITGKWHHFYTAHEPLEYDNRFNRIIKYVSKRLLALSKSNHNRQKLTNILFLMHDVSDKPCFATDCEKVKLNPLYEDYIHILDICKLFLSDQFVDLQNNESSNFCFLLPMEYVFEDFTFGFLSQHWPKAEIKSQSNSYLASRHNKSVFKISNDIIIEKQLIVDTKYKLRSKSSDNKAGVSQADMYQMVSYALKRNCNDVLLLYPQVDGTDNEDAEFKIQTDMLDLPINIMVKNIDITFSDLKSATSDMYGRFETIIPHLAK